jgi:UPF0716 protein FxsA
MRVPWIPLGLLISAIIEIVAFVLVADAIGWGWAILLAVATSIVGAVLLRREGTKAWTRFRDVTAAGERPGPHLTRSVVGLIGAFLLMVPGFVTDVIGAALLLPPVRAGAGAAVTRLASRRLPSATMGEFFGPRKVRVRVGKTTVSEPDTGVSSSVPVSQARVDPAGQPHSASAGGAEVLEGEIIDPR